jgi:hypothetical protein
MALNSLLLLVGCTQPVPQHFTRTELSKVRRMPQTLVIDDGHPEIRNNAFSSIGFESMVTNPADLKSVESSTVGDELNTLTTTTTTRAYIHNKLLNFLYSISFYDNISTGITGQLSFGNDVNENMIDKSIVEINWFIRTTAQYNKLSLSFRPSLVIYNTYQFSTISDSGTLFSITSSYQHRLGFSFAGTGALRYQLITPLGIYCGFQYKLQPYGYVNDKLRFDNTGSIYTGIDFIVWTVLKTGIYSIFPLPADYTDFKEPIHIGANLSVDFGKLSTEND